MIYLTFNDQPSGVYSSQVNDVVNFLSSKLDAPIQLVAFISIRGFFNNRRSIKKEVPQAMVVPILPKASYHQIASFIFTLYCRFTSHHSVISRNVMATIIAFDAKKKGVINKICYDGRGAIASEWSEYDVVKNNSLKQLIYKREKLCVMNSDFRIAVSSKLIEYWQKEFGYNSSEHVVVPCTLNSINSFSLPSESYVEKIRLKEGYQTGDIILIYSGSTAGWQSFTELFTLLDFYLQNYPLVKILFLSKTDRVIDSLINKHPGRVKCKWVNHTKIQDHLLSGDYGILVRSKSTTNYVAAPTKFAEYLLSGLRVLISPDLGDYSNFVEKNNCGDVVTSVAPANLTNTSYSQKTDLEKLVNKHFNKSCYINEYSALINKLNS
jgi:hypothetical protein